MTHPLYPLTQPSLTTHAYAYTPTPMRETLTHWPQTNTPRTQLHRPRIRVVESRQTTHMRGRVTPDHAYAYAWDSHPLATDQHPTHTTTQTNTLRTST
ncbi:hypothetical protein PIB30_108379, partial [Stylosanthes scabra]|nr:hypothetical protein [Stylosanthes scabra]